MSNIVDKIEKYGLQDWIEKTRMNGCWRLYEKSREFVQLLGFTRRKDWFYYCKSGKKPDDIPICPEFVYKGMGWVGWSDFLGTGGYMGEWRTFEEARLFVRSLGLELWGQWKAWAKTDAKPNDVPSNPWHVYKGKGWSGIRDWLGSAFKPFDEARAFVRSLGFKDTYEWKDWAKSDARPKCIPVSPFVMYKGRGWCGMRDWLGTGFLSFEEARLFARSLGIEDSFRGWRVFCQSGQRPIGVPSNPNIIYKAKGWDGWGDWLGKHHMGHWQFFEEAREFVRSLRVKSQKEWRRWSKTDAKPDDIPACPENVYKGKGWESWGDWLGTA